MYMSLSMYMYTYLSVFISESFLAPAIQFTVYQLPLKPVKIDGKQHYSRKGFKAILVLVEIGTYVQSVCKVVVLQ